MSVVAHSRADAIAKVLAILRRALLSVDCCIVNSICTTRHHKPVTTGAVFRIFKVLIESPNPIRRFLHWVVRGIQQCAAPTWSV
jgi:hypothetical protein